MLSLTLTSAAASGAYHGTITGGASNAFAGQVFNVSGFTNALNNGTWVCTASSATVLTLNNSASVAETHAATATDVTVAIALDAGGSPSTVVTAAAATGTANSSEFAVLSRGSGGARNLWLALDGTTGTFSAFKVDLQVSFDGGASWQTQQAAIDLFNSPAQAVSPAPPVGAVMRLNVSTFTGGTTANVVASAN